MGDLTFRAYGGDHCALLAFDYPQTDREDLAGFAVWCTPPGGKEFPLSNRLSFSTQVTATTTPEQRVWTPTPDAPLQRFHWAHVPRSARAGAYAYRATAMLFKPGSETDLVDGPSAQASVELVPADFPKFQLGFTRGYVSSQAYADEFGNAPLVPDPQTIDFDTTTFEAQYTYLGSDARQLVFQMLDEAVSDPNAALDVFAFDLDEPDVIRRLEALGSRLRIFLDDSDSHVNSAKDGTLPPEVDAKARLQASAGNDNVKSGHFGGLAHDKVFIMKRGGTTVKVLAGSANFSVRGLYVQSNNVFVFSGDAALAAYQQAFEQAWEHALVQYPASDVASRWFDLGGPGMPDCSVSFAPHIDATMSLGPVASAIAGATSSVLFAIMEIGRATGPVVEQVLKLPQRTSIYAAGTTQKLDGRLKVTTPADPNSPFIPFGYLKSKVPEPFRAEIAGGSGQVIHHKFVVCDFNGANPVAFAGSSNLAKGGEQSNGDNLVAFRDREIVTRYAIQAVQLIDHYRFRAAQKAATDDAPLALQGRSGDWTQPFYDATSARSRERLVMVGALEPAPA
jgi:phosphatidylserine/phosphatidylglycerophosphate/cardiolipin synthase-like enzyme